MRAALQENLKKQTNVKIMYSFLYQQFYFRLHGVEKVHKTSQSNNMHIQLVYSMTLNRTFYNIRALMIYFVI